LTPYAFFWQASQEAEEDIVKYKIKEVSGIGNSPQISKKEMMLSEIRCSNRYGIITIDNVVYDNNNSYNI